MKVFSGLGPTSDRIFGPPEVARRVCLSFCLSVCPSVCPFVLLSVQACSWNCIISFFLNFGMVVLETHIKLYVTEPDFLEKICCPKNQENEPKMGQKQVFLNLFKHFLINFYWICAIMKIYIISCVSAEIPYLGKFWFLRYRPNFSKPIRL